MSKIPQQAEAVLYERFGKDSIISIATTVNDIPYVRNVDAYYEDGSFYVLTYALSNKMKQIAANPMVAISDNMPQNAPPTECKVGGCSVIMPLTNRPGMLYFRK